MTTKRVTTTEEHRRETNPRGREPEHIAEKRCTGCTFFHSFATYQRGRVFIELAGFFFGGPMLFATVSRGKKVGTRLLPHLFQDNRYRVQLGKQGPYIPITDYREIPSYLANGYSLLMSNRADSQTPSLIRPRSVQGWSANIQDLFFRSR